MTSFEFVFGLISVITSLALTQLLSGLVTLYRWSARLRLSWRHALWTAQAFMLLIGNWSALWGLKDKQAWSALDVLIPVLYISVLYAFCDLVMPDKPEAGAVMDLREYHVRQGKRYKVLQLIFSVLVVGAIAHSTTSVREWAEASVFGIIAVVMAVVALRARTVWLDTATSAGFAVLAAAFMVGRLQVLSTTS